MMRFARNLPERSSTVVTIWSAAISTPIVDGTIRVDGKLDRRLAPAGAQAADLHQQPLADQLIDDIGDRLAVRCVSLAICTRPSEPCMRTTIRVRLADCGRGCAQGSCP